MSYHSGFFHTRPKALAQFDTKKIMFYTLMERGRHMLKKINIYIGSVRFGSVRFGYSNKQISYQGQPKVIAKFKKQLIIHGIIIT